MEPSRSHSHSQSVSEMDNIDLQPTFSQKIQTKFTEINQKIKNIWATVKEFLKEFWSHMSKFEVVVFALGVVSLPVICVFQQWELIPLSVTFIAGTVTNVLRKMQKARLNAPENIQTSAKEFLENSAIKSSLPSIKEELERDKQHLKRIFETLVKSEDLISRIAEINEEEKQAKLRLLTLEKQEVLSSSESNEKHQLSISLLPADLLAERKQLQKKIKRQVQDLTGLDQLPVELDGVTLRSLANKLENLTPATAKELKKELTEQGLFRNLSYDGHGENEVLGLDQERHHETYYLLKNLRCLLDRFDHIETLEKQVQSLDDSKQKILKQVALYKNKSMYSEEVKTYFETVENILTNITETTNWQEELQKLDEAFKARLPLEERQAAEDLEGDDEEIESQYHDYDSVHTDPVSEEEVELNKNSTREENLTPPPAQEEEKEKLFS